MRKRESQGLFMRIRLRESRIGKLMELRRPGQEECQQYLKVVNLLLVPTDRMRDQKCKEKIYLLKEEIPWKTAWTKTLISLQV